MSINYENGVIYKICSKNINIKEIYVGSTCSFKARKCAHKKACNNENSKKYNLNVYQFIRNNGGFDNFDMIEVERYKATDKKNLHKRERYWFETLEATLNSNKPGRTSEEHSKKIKESNKKWYENNKEQQQEHHKEYYENNKEQINKRRKEYYENNKEQIDERLKEYGKEYRENNKEKINERVSEKYTCVCGSSIRKDGLSKHNKSKKHQAYLQNLTTN